MNIGGGGGRFVDVGQGGRRRSGGGGRGLARGGFEKRVHLAADVISPREVIEPPRGHARQLGEFGGRRRAGGVNDRLIRGTGAILDAEALVAERDLVDERQAPGGLGREVDEAGVDGVGVKGVAGFEEIVGELVAGAPLPIGPTLRVVGDTGLFGAEQFKRREERFLGAFHFAQGDGEQVTGLGDVFIGGPLIDVSPQRGDGGLEVAFEAEGVGGLKMSAGAVVRCEVEETQARVKFGGFGVVARLKMGFGDLELRGLRENLIVLEALAGQFER